LPWCQLALVLARRHQAQRPGVVPVRKDGDRERRQRTTAQQFHAGLGELARELRVVDHQTVHVDGREAKVLPEDAQTEVAVGVDVDLPDFAVPAARAERTQTKFDMPPGQGVQHDVHTLAARRRHQVVVPGVAVRIERPSRAHRQELLTLVGVAGRRIDLGANVPGERDRGLPDAPHGGVDQDALAFPEPGQVDQGVIGGNVDRQGGRGLLHAEARGLGEEEVLL